MANDFNASINLNTADATKGVKELDTAVGELDKKLAALDKTIKSSQGNLDTVVKSMSELTRANAALIRSETDRSKASVQAARADRELIINNQKAGKTANDRAIAEAKAARIRSAARNSDTTTRGNESRKDTESQARIATNNAVGQQKLATETVRTAVANENLAASSARAGAAQANQQLATLRLSQAQERARNSALALNDSLSNSRYLLYDVGQTYSVLSHALLAIPVATAQVAIAYEKDFAQVMRTNMDLEKSGGSFSDLRQELKDLATQIPLTFSEFSKISTVGGQLGIAGKDMGAFTETVARFGAASNVSLDEASTAFGRFKQSFKDGETEDYFNKLGSAIAYVGVKSVASEAQIIAVANQISAAGSQFGFASQEIVGLSGALASVRIRPEMARGAFQRIMLGLSSAADEGAASFQNFAKYTEVAGDEAVKLFKTDPAAFFQQYIKGIKDAISSTGSVSTVLEDIGAKNVFDKQFILGLANGYDVFAKSMQDASTSWDSGTFLNESTAGIFETVDAKMQRLASSVKNLQDTLGKGSLNGLSGLADALLGIVNATDRFAQATPAFTGFVNVALGLGSAIGILLAFKAAQAFVLAGLVGFQQVLGRTSIAAGLTLKGNLQELMKTMLMAKGASAEYSAALLANKSIMQQLGVTARTTSAAIANGTAGSFGVLAPATAAASTGMKGFAASTLAAGRSLTAMAGGPIGIMVAALATLGFKFIEAEEQANQAGDAIGRAMSNGAEAAKNAIGQELVKRTVDSYNPFETAAGLGDHGKNVRQLAQEIGVDFNAIVNSISKGKGAAEDFNKVLDKLAQNKGYANWAEMSANAFDDNAAKAKFLEHVVTQLGEKSAKTSEDQKAVAKASGEAGDAAAQAAPEMEGLEGGLGAVGDKAQEASDKIEKAIDSIFGLVDAASATQGSLGKLGEGIQKSGSMNSGDEAGRDNLSNFQDVLRNAALEQQALINSGEQTIQQASANYTTFIDNLMQEMAARGVDVTQIQALANQAKGVFANTMQSDPQPTIGVNVDKSHVDEAKAYLDSVVAVYGTTNLDVILRSGGTEQTQQNVFDTMQYVQAATGEPYIATVDADTSSANDNVTNTFSFASAVLGPPITMVVDANTDPAAQALQAIVQYAAGIVNQIIDGMNTINQVGSDLTGGFLKNTQYSHVGWGEQAAPPQHQAPQLAARPDVPTQAKPQQSRSKDDGGLRQTQDNTDALAGLKNGYDDAAAAAQKAGEKGKKAGEDAANGIDEATRAADDYADRLRQGLQAAYDKQNGLSAAVDAYHTKLNEIQKKRKDELQQIQDLIAKQKELKNAAAEDRVGARKAGIEKDISTKYGEGDRAADYAQQEKDLLDSAAAKEKDAAAAKTQADEISAGIGKMDGFSQAAIDNRNDLRDLESKMLDMVGAYANTGASQEQVRQYAQKLTGQFKTDVTQLGINKGAVEALKGRMQLYRDTVNSVPRTKPTSVTANTGAAKGAIDGIKSALNSIPKNTTATVTVNKRTNNWVTGGVVPTKDYLKDGSPVYHVVNPDGSGTNLRIYNKGGQVQGFANGGQIPGRAPSNPSVDNLMAKVDGGGVIRVRSEEFIMQQPAVDYWGLDFMNAINNMKMPQFNGGGSIGGGRGSGSGSGDAMLVELTPENLQAIMRLADRDINLFAGVEKLASSVNEGQKILASKGVS